MTFSTFWKAPDGTGTAEPLIENGLPDAFSGGLPKFYYRKAA